MKLCPRCGKSYSDDGLNFCLDDGELLAFSSGTGPPPFKDDSPPTILLDSPRVTNPIGWEAGHPIETWQGRSPGPQTYQPPAGLYRGSRDQTLPTIALILGILSITLVCCFGGIYFGVPAAALGFLGMRNADKAPDRYGGRGMAIAGLVIGIITFLISMVHIFASAFSNL